MEQRWQRLSFQSQDEKKQRDQQASKTTIKQSISSRFSGFFNKKKNDKLIEHLSNQNLSQSQKEDQGNAQMQDLKKCMLEMSLVDMIRDDLKRSNDMQFEVKIGDELVAKWFEPKTMSSQHGLIKKIRFPFKFRFLNSKISQIP